MSRTSFEWLGGGIVCDNQLLTIRADFDVQLGAILVPPVDLVKDFEVGTRAFLGFLSLELRQVLRRIFLTASGTSSIEISCSTSSIVPSRRTSISTVYRQHLFRQARRLPCRCPCPNRSSRYPPRCWLVLPDTGLCRVVGLQFGLQTSQRPTSALGRKRTSSCSPSRHTHENMSRLQWRWCR